MSELLDKLEPLGIYNPRGVKHSIIEVVLQVNFDKPIPDVTKWKDKIKSSYLEQRFGHQDDCMEIVLAFNSKDGLSKEPKKRRRKIGFVIDDGISEKQGPKWILAAHDFRNQSAKEALLRLHCLRYFDSKSYFNEAAAVCKSFSDVWPNLKISSFYLMYIDRFYYHDGRVPDLSLFFSAHALQTWNSLVGEDCFGAFNSHSVKGQTVMFKTISNYLASSKKASIIEIRHASHTSFSKKKDERMALEQWLKNDDFMSKLKNAKINNQDFLKETLSKPVLEKIGLF